MLRAFLLGDSSQVQKIWTEHYRRTGTFHALVISGQHLSVITGVLIALLRWILPGSRLGLFAGIAIAWIYAFLAGWTPPVIRAAAGLSLFLAGSIVYRRARVLNVLAAVTIAFLLIDPGQVWDASFQLSFLAVAAIGGLAAPLLDRFVTPYLNAARHLDEPDRDLTLGPAVAECQVELRLLARTFSLITRLPEPLAIGLTGFLWRGLLTAASLLSVTLAIQAVLALPMIWYFHRAPVSGLLANLLIAIPVEIALMAGFAGLVLDWAWAARLSFAMLEFTGEIVRFSAAWEPDVRIPSPPAWFAAALVLSLLLLAWSLRAARFRWIALPAALAGLILLLAPPFRPVQHPGSLEFTAIDVGQGDGLLLSFPRGATMLVDGGGGPGALNTGEDVIGPYLWSRRIRRVDVIAVTHAHSDHIGGVVALIDAFQPRELWAGLMHPANPDWQAVEAAARRHRVQIRQPRAGDCFHIDGVEIRALAPFPDEIPPVEPHNNDSLVLALAHGRHRFLLAGDAEAAVEQRLLTPDFGRFDVLKVGHHGSRTSTSEPFLEAVRPAIVVLSAGRRNRFRHPHPLVMARFEERKVQMMRTDRDGLVTVRSDGRRLEVDLPVTASQAVKIPAWE
jgi:competence protein ComEC